MKRLIIQFVLLLVLFQVSQSQNLVWREVGRMPIPVKGHRAIALDSVIIIIGGFSDSLNSPVDFIQEYNPRTNTWKIVGQTKFKRLYFQVSRVDDSLLIFGGITRSNFIRDYYSLEVWKRNSLPYIYKYNPIFNRIFSTSLTINNRVLIFGGRKAMIHQDTNRVNYLVEYDFIRDSVLYSLERLHGVPEQPTYQTVSRINDYVFLFGGISIGVMNGIYRYNTNTRQIEKLPVSLFIPRAGSESVELDNNSIMIIGGFNENSKALRSTEIFKSQGNFYTSEPGPPLIYPRREFAAVKFKNSIYVFGGANHFDDVVPFVEKLDLTTTVNEEELLIPEDILLEQNFPNPFNSQTIISFKISQKSNVFLEVLDIFGNRIKVIVKDQLQPGYYSYIWDGLNEIGERVASGTYFYRIVTERRTITKKMLLIK